MDNQRYQELEAQLPASVRMKLDHIKRFLNQGKASVMVGAGFSQNAEMDDTSMMKDWNRLAIDFYQRLYSKEPEDASLKFTTPMRLASLVESSFGRNELDELIISSLRDDCVRPGEIHISLLKLHWKDVFTTNYDTLLERACKEAGRDYQVVTNRDTLVYKTSPRIIKLHGSFPYIRPFIITEEDYRKYPQDYPEFVNTVRQTMIENLFCLIGFSGDDPNFLSWLGWVRDIMGNQIAPTYLVTFDKNYHEANKKLFASRGIDIVNLGDNIGIADYSEAMCFFLRFLEPTPNTKWSGKAGLFGDVEQINSIINEMRKVRLSYPGWILLPTEYLKDFEINENLFLMKDFLSQMKEGDRLEYLYELDWRLTISLTPKNNIIEYVSALENLSLSDDMIEENAYESFISLKISLLSIYRQRRVYNKFDALKAYLQDKIQSKGCSPFFKQRFFYEIALQGLVMLDNKEVEHVLNDWNTSSSDYLGILWKSSILFEIGRKNDAVQMLQGTLDGIGSRLLNNNDEDIPLQSLQVLLEDLLGIYDNSYRKASDISLREKIGFHGISFFLIQRIQENVTKKDIVGKSGNESITKYHEFNIASIGKRFHFGRGKNGFDETYYYAASYILLHELSGFPLLDGDDLKIVLNTLSHYKGTFPIIVNALIRAGSKEITKAVFTRVFLQFISREECSDIYDRYIKICEEELNTTNKHMQEQITDVIIPALSCLCTKLSPDTAIRLFYIHQRVFLNYPDYYESKNLYTIYNCLNKDDMAKILSDIYETPIQLNRFEKDIDLPVYRYYYHGIQISEESTNIVIDGLKNGDNKIQKAAYTRTTKLWNASLTEEQRNRLVQAICAWRSQDTPPSSFRYSYNLVPYQQGLDNRLPETICGGDIEAFVKSDFIYNRSSDYLQSFNSSLNKILVGAKYITAVQHNSILEKIIGFLKQNENYLNIDDSHEWFGGFRRFSLETFHLIRQYVEMGSFDKENHENMKDLCDIIERFGEYGFPYLSITIKLHFLLKNKWKLSEIRDKIRNNLFINEEQKLTDATHATYLLASERQSIQELIKEIISNIRYADDDVAPEFLSLLAGLVRNSLLTKEPMQMLSRFIKEFYKSPIYILSSDFDIDTRYYFNRLAGIMSVKTDIEEYKDIATVYSSYVDRNNERVFADEQLGYYMGQWIGQNNDDV
jgi:NAD-dependent SIR2 family protein deacetylase